LPFYIGFCSLFVSLSCTREVAKQIKSHAKICEGELKAIKRRARKDDTRQILENIIAQQY